MQEYQADAQTTAWAAGLFDGEGSIIFKKRGVQLALGMTDALTVGYFAWAMGVPHSQNVLFNSHRNPKWKDALYWRVQKRSDVIIVLKKLLPHLITKRKKAFAALSFLEK